jgi:hypothetical protein
MVVRTNMMDAYAAGAHEERQDPEVQAYFPVWKYLGILDGRQGEDHEPKFNRYYPSTADFRDVRGPRLFNCRCASQDISYIEWERLQKQGAKVETTW